MATQNQVNQSNTMLAKAILIFLSLIKYTTSITPPIQLNYIKTSATDPYFHDEHNRIRIFHGINRMHKAFPWYVNDSDIVLEDLQAIGINIVRLGWFWSGFNPSPGVFNATYLHIIQRQVQRFADHGIHTLLDMHQDVMSSKFCLYDGVPIWVVDKSIPRHPFPWPLTGNCSSRGWMINSLSEAAAKAYQDLYDNTNGMLDDLAMFWSTSASNFVNNSNVIGYEIINEPFAGDFYQDPSILIPGIAGSKNLAKMYEKVASEIRKQDDRHIIFYEPVTWGMIFDNKIIGSGFTQVPGGDSYRNRSALSFHYYCSTFVPGYDKLPKWRKDLCDSTVAPLVFSAVKKDIQQIGGAAIMTEGLSCPNDIGGQEECHIVQSHLDQQFLSWTDYADSQNYPFAPNDALKTLWSRTYARAIAGNPRNMTFNPVTLDFEFCYVPNVSIKAPTEIFIPKTYTYRNGFEVSCDVGLICIEKGDVLLVTVSTKQEDVKGESIKCVRVKSK